MSQPPASLPSTAPRQLRPRRRWDALPYIFLAPAVLVLATTLIAPLFYNLGLSFQQVNLLEPENNRWVGLENYLWALRDPATRYTFGLTLGFTAVTVFFELLLGLGLALILNLSFRGNRFVRVLLLIPMMVSEVVAALSWRLLMHTDFGLINYLLSLVGIERQAWLGSSLAIPAIMVVEVWQHTPFVMLILLAGLQSLPRDVIEAGEVDGAGPIAQFRYIIWPLLTPIVLLALVFRTMFTLRVFTPVWVLTGGGPADQTMVIGVDIYRTAFRYYDFGKAATLSWILLIVTVIITLVYMRLLRREALS
jgi:multiple sugar transport system permease protein